MTRYCSDVALPSFTGLPYVVEFFRPRRRALSMPGLMLKF
uniref:Uncharacterized protein n=1 Tax=Octopus bimaculoides TaxID=37653 RepID=A0A0L8FM39_OCTBM